MSRLGASVNREIMSTELTSIGEVSRVEGGLWRTMMTCLSSSGKIRGQAANSVRVNGCMRDTFGTVRANNCLAM